MTIKQMATKLGVSPQAIYQKLKKNNIEVYSLTDKKTKDLTGEGEVIITKLFSSDPAEIKPSKQTVIDGLQEQLLIRILGTGLFQYALDILVHGKQPPSYLRPRTGR